MVKKMHLLVLLLASLALVAGCNSDSSEGPSREVTLDAEDNGSQVELEKDGLLVISLGANPSTGYTWEVTELDEEILRQKGEAEFESGAADSLILGAPGVLVFHFEAVNTGQTALKLIYHQPWLGGGEPAETFSIQVVVR